MLNEVEQQLKSFGNEVLKFLNQEAFVSEGKPLRGLQHGGHDLLPRGRQTESCLFRLFKKKFSFVFKCTLT